MPKVQRTKPARKEFFERIRPLNERGEIAIAFASCFAASGADGGVRFFEESNTSFQQVNASITITHEDQQQAANIDTLAQLHNQISNTAVIQVPQASQRAQGSTIQRYIAQETEVTNDLLQTLVKPSIKNQEYEVQPGSTVSINMESLAGFAGCTTYGEINQVYYKENKVIRKSRFSLLFGATNSTVAAVRPGKGSKISFQVPNLFADENSDVFCSIMFIARGPMSPQDENYGEAYQEAPKRTVHFRIQP